MAEAARFAALQPEAAPLPAAIVAQAADWMALLQSGSASAAQQARCAAWRAADGRHELAWQRLVALDEQVQAGARPAQGAGTAHAAAARQALHAVARQQSRRRMGRWLLGLAGTGVVAWNVREHTPWPVLAAQHRTATGERLDLVLDDGTRLQIASASAVDLRYTATERRIVLHAGEILVASGHGDPRPLSVATQEGRATPVGTRFTVRRTGGGWTAPGETAVAVLEGAVDLMAHRSASVPLRLAAGEQARFSAEAMGMPAAAPAGTGAWSDGMLVAERMRLDDFVAELSRWRPGLLRCAPDAAALRITGAFPLDDSDRALALLASILPVRVEYRTRWWVMVRAA